nr:septin-2-like [Penaeus vannamei]
MNEEDTEKSPKDPTHATTRAEKEGRNATHSEADIVDTVGYGDQINKKDSFTAIVDYIDKQFDDYLQEELKIKRCLSAYHDARIHACLYFICPTGHGLKSIDLVCMKKLDSKVNVIPIIAKADTISKAELTKFKQRIIQEIKANNIQIYQFPTDDDTMAKVCLSTFVMIAWLYFEE